VSLAEEKAAPFVGRQRRSDSRQRRCPSGIEAVTPNGSAKGGDALTPVDRPLLSWPARFSLWVTSVLQAASTRAIRSDHAIAMPPCLHTSGFSHLFPNDGHHRVMDESLNDHLG